MKRFEYKQVDYTRYPSASELNEKGNDGWEMIFIYEFKRDNFDDELEIYYTKKMYKVTFKREIL